MIGTKVLEERESKFNGNLSVVRTLGYGTYISSGGLTQSGGIIKSIWGSTLRKVKKQNPYLKNVLVLGLGGGSAAGLVRKYWPKVEITGVDIDPVMVELGKKYLNLDEAKVNINITDAYKFIMLKRLKYDLVLVDLYHGDIFPEKFEDESFLKKLTSSKIVVFNRLYYGEKRSQAVKFLKKLEKIFIKADPLYPEANIMFLCYNS